MNEHSADARWLGHGMRNVTAPTIVEHVTFMRNVTVPIIVETRHIYAQRNRALATDGRASES